MYQPSRFVPASMDAFRRAARDLQRAYALPLQYSQEALARIYAYPNLHALQEHLKLTPAVGPFDDELEPWAANQRDCSANATLADFLGHAPVPSGHLEAWDLMLFATPDARRAHMDFEHQLEAAAKGPAASADVSPIIDYIGFELRDALALSGRSKKEGVFRLTAKGKAIRRMIAHLVSYGEDLSDSDDQVAVMKSLNNLSQAFPNDPLSKSKLARLQFQAMVNVSEQTGETELSLAKIALKHCKEVKTALEALMAPRFSGLIEPELVGDGIENEPYMSALSIGTECAYLLEQDRTAKAWGIKYLKLHPRDSFGVRFILQRLGVEH